MSKRKKSVSQTEHLRRLYQKVAAYGGIKTVSGGDGKQNVLIPVGHGKYKVMELNLPPPVVPPALTADVNVQETDVQS